MKNNLLLIILLSVSISQTSTAQRFHIDLYGGLSNYQGDMNEKRFSFKQSHGAFGLGLSYEISDRFTIRSASSIAKLSASDKNGKYPARNLDYTTKLYEGHTALQYYLKNPYEHQVAPYVFGGIALFRFNPYTYDSTGTKVYLRPLSTEGQGFVQGREVYKKVQFAIPFGGGLKFYVSDKVQLGVEVGFRKTFTDYLDDLSKSYVDQNILLANRGTKAVELAYRSDEAHGNVVYPLAGTERGGPKYKDWYYFSMVTASFRIGRSDDSRGGGSKRGLGCPKNF